MTTVWVVEVLILDQNSMSAVWIIIFMVRISPPAPACRSQEEKSLI